MKPLWFISKVWEIIALFLFVYLLLYPQYATQSTRTALEFCGKTLVPSLFIYMVLSKIIISLPVTEKLIKFLGLESVILIIGTLCGCPVGAKVAVTLYKDNCISKQHAEFLCSFSNNASISFVLGFVGSELFGDIRIGLRLMIYQLLASAITAVIMKRIVLGKENLHTVSMSFTKRINLSEAVSDSAITMLNLCGCVIFFMVAGGVISSIIRMPDIGEAILKSVLEFSSGCVAASKAGKYAIPITAFALSQTGFSVGLQVKSIIKSRLSFKPYLMGKLICCTIMTALAFIFG